MERNDPSFRDAVKAGHEVVVGGKAFGCGSSRQEAVQALLGKSLPEKTLSHGVGPFMPLLSFTPTTFSSKARKLY